MTAKTDNGNGPAPTEQDVIFHNEKQTIREEWWKGYYLIDQIAEDGDYITEVYHDDFDEIIQVFDSIADGYDFINRRLEAEA